MQNNFRRRQPLHITTCLHNSIDSTKELIDCLSLPKIDRFRIFIPRGCVLKFLCKLQRLHMNQQTPSIPGLSAWQNAEYQRWEFLMQQKSSMEMFEKLSFKCFDKCVSVGSWNGVFHFALLTRMNPNNFNMISYGSIQATPH